MSDPKDLLDDAIVAKARQAIADLMSTTIEALGKDTKELLAKNGASKTHVSAAAEQFTVEMIKLLAEQVKSILPAALPPLSSGGSSSGPSQPPDAPPSGESSTRRRPS
jgi:hypothetical protein